MTTGPTWQRLLVGLGLLAALAAAAPAQVAEAPPEELFTEILEVQVVNVEVRVTDRKGRPVSGLTREDFELYEDGRRVEISHFAEMGVPEAPAERAGGVPPEPGTPERPVLAAGAVDEPRYFVLFVDLGHMEPGDMRRVLPDLGQLVEQVLGPGDRVMVAEHQQNLRVSLELTGDRAAVAEALARVAETAPQGLQRVSERRQTLREIRAALEAEDPVQNCTQSEAFSAEGAARVHAGWIGSRVQGSISALTSLVRALVGLPGPKTVVYVGAGLELRPAADLFHLVAELCPAYQQQVLANLLSEDLSPSFRRLTADANANRVTFYTLDAGGLRAGSSVEQEDRYVRLSAVGERVQAANLQHPLFLMAEETGGRAVFNTNRFARELEEIARDVDSFYSLGFVPGHQGDGQVHALRVKVLAAHHDARFRTSYRDKPLDERIVEAMLGTLLFRVEDNPLGVDVEIGDAASGEEGGLAVPVRIRVPVRGVVTTPGAGFAVGRLRLVLVALDPEGEWTPVKQRIAPFKVPDGEDPATAVRLFEVTVDLPPGENVLAVGVRDEIGGETSYLRETLHLTTP